MNPASVRTERVAFAAMVVLFAALITLACVDLIEDLGEGSSSSHLLIEGGFLLAGVIGLLYTTHRLRVESRKFKTARAEAELLRERTESLEVRLEKSSADAEHWRRETRELLKGLGEAIDQQFTRWDLTPAQREVALLLLKGLSHGEIAELRGVSEATTRQQARSVYKKGDLQGRHELSAFFLEDLLLPSTVGNDARKLDENLSEEAPG